MNEEVKSDVVAEILADPQGSISPEKLLILMEEWRTKVTSEVDEYNSKKDKVYVVYKRQKEMYDKWLSCPMKKMKKLDKIITERKKVLIDVDREISKLKETISIKIDA